MEMDKRKATLTVDSRTVDGLGRVVIPKFLRVSFDIAEGDEVSFIDNGDEIVLRKTQPCCCVCRSQEDVVPLEHKGKSICPACLKKIKSL